MLSSGLVHAVLFLSSAAKTFALQLSNASLPRHPLDSWLTLEPSARLCLLRDAVSKSIDDIRTVSLPAGNHLPHMAGSCAVVSSSGVLRLHSHGLAIDAADLVMRFNDAPITGWEEKVGFRDDFRLVNEKVLDQWFDPDIASGHPRAGTTYLATCTVCNVGSAHTVSPEAFEQREASLLERYPSLVLFTTNLELEYSLQQFFSKAFNLDESGAGVTTGAVGLVTALSLCDEVVAYGMAAGAHDDAAPYSYWQSGGGGKGKHSTQEWHASFQVEKELWRHLAQNSLADIDQTDIAVIPGFGTLDRCPSQMGARSL